MNSIMKKILMCWVLPASMWAAYFYLPALFQAFVYFSYILVGMMLLFYVFASYERIEKVLKNKKSQFEEWVFERMGGLVFVVLFAYAEQVALLVLIFLMWGFKFACEVNIKEKNNVVKNDLNL